MTREEMEIELSKRNEATKVWIQAETQTRSYCCRLEKLNEELAKRLKQAIYKLRDVHAQLEDLHDGTVEHDGSHSRLADELEQPLEGL